MIIRTNLSWNTLASYSAMLWNNGEDIYTATGENLVECIENEDDPNFVLTVDFLKSDCEWQIDKHFTMLEEDYTAACHLDYLDGCRDSNSVEGHKKYLKWRKGANAFRRQFKKWLTTVEVVPEWTYDTEVDEFIYFPASAHGKAVAVLH